MDSRDELLTAVKDAKRDLEDGNRFKASDMLELLEGLAPFLDRETLVKMKCRSCDNYGSSSFSVSNDFSIVDSQECCHSRELPLSRLSVFKLAGCMEHTRGSQEELHSLARSILDEDLRPAFIERKLYDRHHFTSHAVAFRMSEDAGKVCIEFGHEVGDDFVSGDVKVCIVRRLDPGFGNDSYKIAEAMKHGRPIIVVKASQQTRRLLDIDYVLEWIAEKRKMDIVYL